MHPCSEHRADNCASWYARGSHCQHANTCVLYSTEAECSSVQCIQQLETCAVAWRHSSSKQRSPSRFPHCRHG
jgi:hypothetical protein